MTKARKSDEVFAALTDQLIAAIESDPGNWSKPWRDAVADGIPTNAVTGVPYRGGNIWTLGTERADAGGPQWATYRQWSGVGVQVRPVEEVGHGVTLVRWVRVNCKRHGKGCARCRRPLVPVAFTVHHVGQTIGGAEYVAARYGTDEGPSVDPIEHAQRFIDAQGATILHSEPSRAFYSPRGDYVNVPALDRFDSAERYYGVVLHELAHWSGHRSRLNRDGIAEFDSFGSEQYAREELIAEMASVLVGAGHLSLDMPVREDHAAYLASWLRILKADPKALHRAATKASDAATFLIDAAESADVPAETETVPA